MFHVKHETWKAANGNGNPLHTAQAAATNRLFADAESGKYFPQQIICGELARD
jgi:hypothetical protein